MRPPIILRTLREWTRRVWGALSGRRTDVDLERELEGHIAFAEDEFRRRGHAPGEAARLARVNAGGLAQAVEAVRDQRGLPLLSSSWLDIKLGLRLLLRNWGLTLVGGLAMTVAIAIAAVVFTAFDVVLWSPLPIDEGDRVVAIQTWDPKAGKVRDTAWRDVERWKSTARSVEDVGGFQTIRRNVITADGSVELAAVAEISAAGFRLARVAPLMGRTLVEADAGPGAAPVILIGHDVWQRRFEGARDVIGRELRLGDRGHTIVGVMPEGFQFPFNFRYWVPLRLEAHQMLRDAGPEGVIFGRLATDATHAGAHAEVSALGLLPSIPARPDTEGAQARVVPYTFAFTGNFERGELGVAWSLSSLALILLLLPPCANIAILNYARTVTRQQEFAARHALGGSRARIVCQLFIEALVLSAAAGVVALLVLHVVSIVMAGRLQNIPGGPPFWMSFDVSYRTLLFVALLCVAGAIVSGLVPALQATGRLSRLGSGALAGRTRLQLGATWTTLVVAQVAFSVGVLPLAAELGWGMLRTGVVGPGFPAEEYATARVALEDGERSDVFGDRQRELTGRLQAEPGIMGVSAALRPPGEEPWVFVDIEGLEAPTEVINGKLPGFLARFNQVDSAFLTLYEVPRLAGRGFEAGDLSVESYGAIVNRNFADTVAPGGNALGRRFRYVGAASDERSQRPEADRWYEVIGVVDNLPVTTDARVAYHPIAPGQVQPANLQLRLRGDSTGLAERLRDVAASVDPTLHIDEVRTLADIYREHRFGDNIATIAIGAVTVSVLLLSAAGLYALMVFTVAQRRREIGIRSALGAQPRQLMAAVFQRAFGQIGAYLPARPWGCSRRTSSAATCRSNRSAACRFPASSPARPRSCSSSAFSPR